MNHIYQSIWNETAGTFVAASETAGRRGRRSTPGRAATARVTGTTGHTNFALTGLAMALLFVYGSHVYALPTGGNVAAGNASIVSSPGKTTIHQTTQNVAINWQGFSIGQGESVQFVQPGSNSVALNRVLGSDPSSILGNLSANGTVFLLNPNGILFGKGAQVNVGGLVASTLSLADSDFMAGRYAFTGSSNRSVLNQGSINADGGYVALLGANVSNEGVISARLGTVALAAGSAMTLDVAGDGLLNVTVNQGAVNALVQNGGLIQADGGQVLLSTQTAGNLLQSAINNTGIIQAQSIENRNGTIRLLGDALGGTVSLSGTLDASGKGARQSGGSVAITGRNVGLFDQAKIDASGDTAGGTVLVGGDYQGRSGTLPNATATYMGTDAVIHADAITSGNGGKVILWANDTTRAHGRITAQGGAQGGNGGLIETSGSSLDVSNIRVSTSAENGQYGMWLLDPADITITGAASSPAFSGGNPNVFAPGAGVSTANVNVADITNALLTTGVTITTTNTGAAGAGSGDITIGTPAAGLAPAVPAPITWTAPTTLTLNAVRNVTVVAGSAITATNGSLVINAGGNIVSNAATTTTTGSLSFNAGGNLALNGATTVTTGNISAIAAGTTTVAGAMSVTTGDIILRGDNDGTGPGALIGGTVDVTCGANCLTITTGALRIRFNPASYATTAAEIANYGTKLTGGGTLDAKAWVFGRGDNKVYDGTTAATVSGLKPDIGGVAPAAALGAVTNANFNTKHVGTSKLITYDSTFANAVFDLFAPVGTPAGTYTTRADITVRPLTVSAVTDTRVYNGTTSSVGVPTSLGLQVGDVLNGPLTQAYVSKNVMGLLGSTLAATGPYTVTDGNGGANYAVTVNTAPGTITPLALIGSITAANKVYDGNNTATILTRTLATPIVGDTVTYVGGTALFSDKDVANGKVVTGTGLSLAGADAGNYTVNATALTNANITPAPLTIRANDNTKVYGQTFTPASTAFTVPVAPIPGETVLNVTILSPAGTPPTAAVPGPYAITPSNPLANGAFLPTNYNITFVDGALTVTPAPLTVTANNATKPGGTALTLAGTAFTNSATQNGETVGSVTLLSAGTPAPAPAGVYPITPSAATGGTFTPGNYAITFVNGLLTVDPVPVAPVQTPTQTPVQTPVATLPIAAPGLNLGIVGTGITMPPPVQLAALPQVLPPPVVAPPKPTPVPVAIAPKPVPAPVVVAPPAPPQVYVPPVRPRKADRN